jgi:hypothetical protein
VRDLPNNDFRQKAGDVFYQTPAELPMKRLSKPSSIALRDYDVQRDETAGTVIITLTLDRCPTD